VDHAEKENGLVTGVAATLSGVLLLIKETTTRSPRASIFYKHATVLCKKKSARIFADIEIK
jgi:hypothetical protein